MSKYLWLLILAIPPWAAVKLDAPKWGVMLAVAPFFILAATLGDPDEHLLGDASPGFRKGALVVMGIGGLVLGVVFFILWRVLFAST